MEIASEYRYRNPVVPQNTLFVTISQSGETADTLAALRMAKQSGYLSTLAICNVPESSLVRESELVLLTRAGPEIGVASTKAFTTQLSALGLLIVALAKFHGSDAERERGLVQRLIEIPSLIEKTLHLEPQIKELAKRFADKHHALFLGRGQMYPIALEGALKMKELTYLPAEGFAAGELKHGPIAYIDKTVSIIAIAPKDELYQKTISNIEEVRARGGHIITIGTEDDAELKKLSDEYIGLPASAWGTLPILTTIPLQLMAYGCAQALGRNIDKPRNLAKSVTVE